MEEEQKKEKGEELTEQQKKEIDGFYLKLSLCNYYELLGVDFNANKKEIRASYFSLSKRFHPDAAYGKVTGEYKKKLEKIFSKLTEAYEILSNDKKRKEYDNYLKLIGEIDKKEKKLREIEEKRVEKEREERVIPKPPDNPLLSKTKRWRRRALLRNLTESQRMRVIMQKKEEEIRKAVKSIAENYAESGRKALEAKDYVSAANAFKLAMEMDPEKKEYKTAYENARRLARKYLAEHYLKRGKYEFDIGNYDAAIVSFKKCVELFPDVPEYYLHLVQAMLNGDADLYEAKKYITKAMELKPNVSEYHALLAKIYFKAGLYKNAKREIERAIELAPFNESYKQFLAKVKKFV